MTTATNHVLDLDKAQWASHFYKNQYGNCTQRLPKTITVMSRPLNEDTQCYDFINGEWTLVNAIQLAKEKKVIDVWTEHTVFQLTANHSITFTGKRAKSLWEAWQAKIFSNN